MVENFYFKRDSKERIKQRTNDLQKYTYKTKQIIQQIE